MAVWNLSHGLSNSTSAGGLTWLKLATQDRMSFYHSLDFGVETKSVPKPAADIWGTIVVHVTFCVYWSHLYIPMIRSQAMLKSMRK